MPEDHKRHRQRLKKRFLNEGLENFEKHNILELILFYSIPREDTNPLGHRLIDHFGSLSAVFDAEYEDLLKVKGVGENTALLLKLCPAITKAYMDDRNRIGVVLSDTKDLSDFLIPKFAGETNEVVYLICLDNRRRVLSCEKVDEGTVNESKLHPRKIAEIALLHNATAVVVAHNHPNAYAMPSKSDVRTTAHILHSLHNLGIYLVDHIIVSDTEAVSMEDSGLIDRSQTSYGYQK